MADPFTIRIFVPDGDPEGVRLIDRMNWTGLGLVFRRSDWSEEGPRYTSFSRLQKARKLTDVLGKS